MAESAADPQWPGPHLHRPGQLHHAARPRAQLRQRRRRAGAGLLRQGRVLRRGAAAEAARRSLLARDGDLRVHQGAGVRVARDVGLRDRQAAAEEQHGSGRHAPGRWVSQSLENTER